MSPAKKSSGTQGSGETSTCPWCSAIVPITAATCPSCGASLRDAAEGDILGVTQVDPAAVLRTRRIRSVNIAAFLGVGDGPDDEESTGKVEPPSDEVKREMLRLELAAIDVELEAKAQAAAAQAAMSAANPEQGDKRAKPQKPARPTEAAAPDEAGPGPSEPG